MDFDVLEVCGVLGVWVFAIWRFVVFWGFVGFGDLEVCGVLGVLAIFTGLMLYF